MSKARKNKTLHQDFTLIRSHSEFFEFEHKRNGLRVLLHTIHNTGVVTSNIVYKVGSKHEWPGQTGLAHMLEHMLFKPTSTDIAARSKASIMSLERDAGVAINASTWKDRTNYYCTAPTKFLPQILSTQADQMKNVVITDKNLAAEQTTVLSEFDMYNSDPYFALECAVGAAAFNVHPYRHETIGWRSDIESYTAENLNIFYRTHYQPKNATIIIIGDVTLTTALTLVAEAFGNIQNTHSYSPLKITEPPQEGFRRTSVVRSTTTNILSIAVKSPSFGTTKWLETFVLLKILADGPDSILHRALVDTGKITSVGHSLYPTAEPYLATLTFTLADNTSHAAIEEVAINIIQSLTAQAIKLPLKKTIAQILYLEPFSKDSSYGLASELMEYIATGDWTPWCETEKLIKKITAKELIVLKNILYVPNNMTIGTFVGTEKHV